MRCTFSAPKGQTTDYRYLSVRLPQRGAEGDLLATARVVLGPPSSEPDCGIVIKFPSTWDDGRHPPGAAKMPRPLSSYHAREPLVLDLVTLLLQPGHSRILVENVAAAFVCCILQAEKELTTRRSGKTRLRR